jgi:hypothetical protein
MPQTEQCTERQPWGDLFAEVPIGGEATDWVPICPVYKENPNTSRAALTFEMHTQPLAWRDANVPRRLMIVMRKAAEKAP